MKGNILELSDKKIEQLRHYNEITSQIIYEDIDGVGELIENRQEILTALSGISVDMQQYISEQSIERQTSIKNVLEDSDMIGNLTGELLELQSKIRIMKELTDEINKNDAAARERITKLRDEAYEELKSTAKTRQTIDYMSANSGNGLLSGQKFNKSN